MYPVIFNTVSDIIQQIIFFQNGILFSFSNWQLIDVKKTIIIDDIETYYKNVKEKKLLK